MDFLTYCRAKGILIDYLPPIGVWRRYPTEDKISKRNGAVKYMGTYGHVQNHAIDMEVDTWYSENPDSFDHARLMRDVQAAKDQKLALQREAAKKAAFIMSQCNFGFHEYLTNKGYADEQVCVWARDGIKTMVIPMRVDGHLVGAQMIDEHGEKKFLFGQRTSGASFIFDNRGPNILCEGYATALAIRKALKNMKRRYKLYVCFSAFNMKRVAETLDSGFLVVDHDRSQTGQKVAAQIGWPFWMSDTEGEDADDALKRMGLFKFSQSLVKAMPR